MDKHRAVYVSLVPMIGDSVVMVSANTFDNELLEFLDKVSFDRRKAETIGADKACQIDPLTSDEIEILKNALYAQATSIGSPNIELIKRVKSVRDLRGAAFRQGIKCFIDMTDEEATRFFRNCIFTDTNPFNCSPAAPKSSEATEPQLSYAEISDRIAELSACVIAVNALGLHKCTEKYLEQIKQLELKREWLNINKKEPPLSPSRESRRDICEDFCEGVKSSAIDHFTHTKCGLRQLLDQKANLLAENKELRIKLKRINSIVMENFSAIQKEFLK